MYTLDLSDGQKLYFAHIQDTNVTSYDPAILVASYLRGQFKGGSVVDHADIANLIASAYLRQNHQVQSSAAAYLMAVDFDHSAEGSLILSDPQGDDHELPLTPELLQHLAQAKKADAEPLFAVLMRLPDHGAALNLQGNDASVADAARYLMEHSGLDSVPPPPARPETDLSRIALAERASAVQALNDYETATHHHHNVLQRHQIHASNVEQQFCALLVHLGPADLPVNIRNAVYQEAYTQGHSGGYGEIEETYHRLCGFARNVLNAAKGNAP